MNLNWPDNLQNNNIDYKTDMPEEFKGQILVRCRVQVQKETADGLADDLCNEIAPRNYAGYCKYVQNSFAAVEKKTRD